MTEETIQDETIETVAPVAEAPAATEAVAAEATATTEAPAEQPKKAEPRRDIFAELGLAEEDVKILKANGSKNVTSGIVHNSSTFNNTGVSVTDLKGNVMG